MVLPVAGKRTDTTLSSARGLMLRPIEHAIGAVPRRDGERAEPGVTDVAAE
jgi:hypothetical protein